MKSFEKYWNKGELLPPGALSSFENDRSDDEKMARRKQLMVWIPLTFFGFFVAAFYVMDWQSPGGSLRPSLSVNSANPPSESALEMVGFHWENRSYNSRYLCGTVKNNSFKIYSYVQATFSLYDKSEAQVGSAFANIAHLDAHAIWKFEAYVFEDKATGARFVGFTAY